MAIHIYHSSAWPECGPLPPHWLDELPAARRLELLRSQPERRLESVVGSRLLVHGMRTLGYLDFELSEVRFGRGLKPRIGRGIDFSISHSGGLAACALHSIEGQRVGLDVERIRPLDVNSLAKYLGREHQPGKYSVPEMFRRWTRRESVVKAAGAGLARLAEVEYDCGDAETAQFDGRHWNIQKVDLGREFAAHVTTQTKGTGQYSAPSIHLFRLTWDELCLSPARTSESAR